jgi:hypothetical protein
MTGHILHTMWESCLLNPNGPQGENIRKELGKSYYLIEVPGRLFHCRWHHLEKAGLTEKAAPPGASFDTSEPEATACGIPYPDEGASGWATGNLPCEGYSDTWPDNVRSEAVLEYLPVEALPDGRTVVFIPDVALWGPYTPGGWQRLLQAAKQSRPRLIEHAYKVALGVLALWKDIGPGMAAIRHRCENAAAEGKTYSEVLNEVDPSSRDRGLAQWVWYWARQIHDDPTRPFTPFKEARAVVSRATGIAPSTVGTIVGRMID